MTYRLSGGRNFRKCTVENIVIIQYIQRIFAKMETLFADNCIVCFVSFPLLVLKSPTLEIFIKRLESSYDLLPHDSLL